MINKINFSLMNFLQTLFKTSDDRFKWLPIVAIIFIIIFSIGAGLLIGGFLTYQNKFYPNTKIGNINISHRTMAQAQEIINKASQEITNNGIPLISADQQTQFKLTSNLSATDPDLSRTLFNLDANSTLLQAWNDQHQKPSFQFLLKCITKTFSGWHYKAITNINNEEVVTTLKDTFERTTTLAKSSTINFSTVPPTINLGTSGTLIDYNALIKMINLQLENLDNSQIIVKSQPTKEPVNNNQLSETLLKQLTNIASSSPTIIVNYEDESWKLPFASYKNWLTLDNSSDTITINLDKELATPFWEDIKKDIDKPIKNARFKISNGRVQEFQSSDNGVTFNTNQTLALINDNLNNEQLNPVTAVVDFEKSSINNQDVNDLGITEIIGVGRSNFKGSPKNRRWNIATGAKAINGILVPPQQEFSLIKTLGAIDASTGYLPELVIKGNQTIPEFGGGLCQIGTTVFRATLNTGLNITERRNHSYRVSYYEPAGTDATIYDPKPDFRFKNDTNSHVLIQAYIQGDEVVVEYWGTKDGRQVAPIKPTIYNIVSPGPVQLIETDTLKPGEKKCIESAHAGADAYFDYIVTYANGEEKKERFSSHYVPWRQKCLIGKTATPIPDPNATPTSTTPVESPVPVTN
jgi:vancomycin resistance protein YoaR